MTLKQRDQILSALCAQHWPYQPLLGALDVPPTAAVLDIGAGSGELLRLLQQRGHVGPLVGLDSATAPGVVAGDAHALPFATRSFDVVILLRVFSHLKAPQQALAEARRVLKPGGRLVVAAHGPKHLATLWGHTGVGEAPTLLRGFKRLTLSLPVVVDAGAAQALAQAYGLGAWPAAPFADTLELEIFTLSM